MIEAVGHEHLPLYFDVIASALKPGGLFSMQVSTLCRLLLRISRAAAANQSRRDPAFRIAGAGGDWHA